jgi:hypothetical protein
MHIQMNVLLLQSTILQALMNTTVQTTGAYALTVAVRLTTVTTHTFLVLQHQLREFVRFAAT